MGRLFELIKIVKVYTQIYRAPILSIPYNFMNNTACHDINKDFFSVERFDKHSLSEDDIQGIELSKTNCQTLKFSYCGNNET